MIIDCVSDLHSYYPKLEGGDLLIVAGDFTARDDNDGYTAFELWLLQQDYKKKIIIAGNHDGQICSGKWKLATDSRTEYLCDSGTEFEGLKIWGCPHSLTFSQLNPKCSAFTGNENYLQQKYDLIPNGIDILISHSPPYGILDKCRNGNVGSKTLLESMERIKPKLHVFGHIHECGGNKILHKHEGPNTWCVNASIVDEYYDHVNEPIRVIL